LWEELISDLLSGLDIARMAYKFHLGVARAIRDGVLYMSRSTGLNKVVISGGVFQNKLLTELVMELLAKEGIAVYRHKEVPPNDGGISLGQAVIGNEVTKNVLGSTP
jgi:hydrogenase maturation protein HypF